MTALAAPTDTIDTLEPLLAEAIDYALRLVGRDPRPVAPFVMTWAGGEASTQRFRTEDEEQVHAIVQSILASDDPAADAYAFTVDRNVSSDGGAVRTGTLIVELGARFERHASIYAQAYRRGAGGAVEILGLPKLIRRQPPRYAPSPGQLPEQFTPQEWLQLQVAPYLVLMIVSGEGVVASVAEMTEFARELAGRGRFRNDVLRAALCDAVESANPGLDALVGEPSAWTGRLTAIGDLADRRLDPAEALSLKAALLYIARQWAGAVRGSFGCSEEIGAAQRAALATVATTLGLVR